MSGDDPTPPDLTHSLGSTPPRPPEPCLSQADVHYRPGKKERRCGNCTTFQPEARSCARVQGEIHPTMLCDRWSPLKHVHRLR